MSNNKNRSNNFCSIQQPDRRKALQLLGAAGAGALIVGGAGVGVMHYALPMRDKIATNARIVIVGAGAAGLTSASMLSAQLEGASITLIDARKEHYYQPGFTLIGAGIKPANYSTSTTAEYVAKGVEWLQERVAEIDPESNRVITESAKSIPYDYLIVATGLTLNYGAIEGMSIDLIGQNGIGSIYQGPEAANATWKQMSEFTDKGGIGLFLRPNTEMKCAGVPLKYTFLTEDYLTRKGTRNKSEIIYNSNNNALFSVPIISEKIRMLFHERNIMAHYNRQLTAIDPARRIATFTTQEGSTEMGYDFIHVIPPMRAPDVIRNSPLPWQTGPYAEDGWMEVERHTLRHTRYSNIFGLGDIAGVPKGKTAASVKWQVPVAIEHLVADIQGKTSSAHYGGYTSCPVLTRIGKAMLIEFDYNNNLLPSFPGIIAPLEELWLSWIMKTMGVKPTYMAMLRGQI